jgi:hypothetical protein
VLTPPDNHAGTNGGHSEEEEEDATADPTLCALSEAEALRLFRLAHRRPRAHDPWVLEMMRESAEGYGE